MATGRIILPALAFYPLDGSAGNEPCLMDFIQSSGTAPAPRFPRWAMDEDNGGTDKSICIAFRMPGDYASAPVFKYDFYSGTGGQGHQLEVRVAAISTTEPVLTKVADAANTDTPQSADPNDLVQNEVTLSNADSLAADDFVMLILTVPPSGGSPLPTWYFLGGILEYTTT